MVVAFVFVAVFVLLFEGQNRVKRLEQRVRELEDRLRRQAMAPAPEARAVGPEPLPADLPKEPGEQLAAVPPRNRPAIRESLASTAAPVADERLIAPPQRQEPQFEKPIADPKPVMAQQAAARPSARADASPRRSSSPPTPPAPKPKRNWSVNFEDLFGRKLPIWAGGITLAIAGVLIVKYAVDAGLMALLTPTVRVALGGLFGCGLIGGAELALRHEAKVQDPRVRQALSGAGNATLYATIIIAANVYGLIGPIAAILSVALVTAAALALSIRFGAPSAVLGLAGGLAAPAMVGSAQPNVPLLAVYLALTVAGVAGVSRMQRWVWLGIVALAGGMGWSLWIVIASGALDTLGTLSLGGYVILLAIALPLLVVDGPRAALIRSVAAIVGAAQLALMVALGGFSIVNWALFIMLAAAGQWLNRREPGFAIVPTISLALSVLLLTIWPEPAVTQFATVGVLLLCVHGIPLFLTIWAPPTRLQRTIEYCALALAALAVPFLKLYTGEHRHALGVLGLAAAMIPTAALASGWRRSERHLDVRFSLLAATMGVLLSVAGLLLFATWFWPVAIAAIAAGVLLLSITAQDKRVEGVAAGFALASLQMLLVTGFDQTINLLNGTETPLGYQAILRWSSVAALFGGFGLFSRQPPLRSVGFILSAIVTYGLFAQLIPGWALPVAMAAVAAALLEVSRRYDLLPASIGAAALGLVACFLLCTTGSAADEWARLAGIGDATLSARAMIRWTAVFALAAHLWWRHPIPILRIIAQIFAGLLAYGAVAQVVPPEMAALIAPALLVALAVSYRNRALPLAAAAALVVIMAGWVWLPLNTWANEAILSLTGEPMAVDRRWFGVADTLKRLVAPALALLAVYGTYRAKLASAVRLALLITGGGLTLIAVHILYRLGFAAVIGDNFVWYGAAQRVLWEALFIAIGYALARLGKSRAAIAALAAGTAHSVGYSLILHDPIWSPQAVGAIPLVNLIAPLFGLAATGFLLLQRELAAQMPAVGRRGVQLALMLIVVGFCWATLRQAFHGSLLVQGGVDDVEDILRSILGIVLAIGFLLWGVRSQQRDWRLASLILMLGAAAKVFLLDASGLEGLMRIASFVALGFSLIGIGWLYSRQLGRDEAGRHHTTEQ